ncbi:MAG: SusC/RagA family protein [Candidatus Nephrothrix sp. EaCA]|nr:MAG: SusC/RagA family protein [Candidatus Nephrothrix sp. EaCA]
MNTFTKCLLPVIFLMAQTAFAQRTVSGKITGADDGSPIPGVHIAEKNTAQGTASDADGNYSLSVSDGATLVFTFVGYLPQEIAAGARSVINVTMELDVKTLHEVVVVGYGEVQKKDATGAAEAIGGRDFNKGVLTSPQDLIVGKLAGVSVVSSSGAPTSGSTIRIRGGSSLNASNDPLIVIDGFPVDNVQPGGTANILSSINPHDIESFTVLKDASAAAIYGSRAANGVLIITTKKGAKGDANFSYNLTTSVSAPVKYLDLLTGDEFRTLIKEQTATGVISPSPDELKKLGAENTDWQKEIYRAALSHDHNLSAGGSYKGVPFRLSYGYTDQQGILKNTGAVRNSLHLNLTPAFLEGNLKTVFSLKGSLGANNFGEAGAVGSAAEFDPTQSVYDKAAPQYGGYFSWLKFGNTNGSANPAAQVNQTDNKSDVKRLIGNVQLEYRLRFLPAVKLTVNAGADLFKSVGHNLVPLDGAFVQNQGTLVGRQDTYWAKNHSELLDIYGNYLKESGRHKIDFTAGYGWQRFWREGETVNKDISRTLYVPFSNQNYLVSFFGRLNYAWNGKYLLTGTLRADGSSRFSKTNRWGLFPSAALAWRLKDESFLKDVKAVSDLKLRAGYGVTGQQDIQGKYFPYLSTYQISDKQAQYQLGYHADGSPRFYATLRPNAYDESIKWETTATANFGIDFGLWADRLTGSAEIFRKDTKDLLNEVAIPNGVNFSNRLVTNVGSMQNDGLEITLRANVVSKNNFTWTIGANAATVTSKITKLTLNQDPNYLGISTGVIDIDAYIQNHQVGYAPSAFFPLQQVYNAEGAPIEGLYVDRSGSGGEVGGNERNKYRYKRPTPDCLIGLNSRIEYRDFDFSFSSRLSLGNYVYNAVESRRNYYLRINQDQIFRNLLRSINDTKFANSQLYSDFYVQNASFFKMDNISAGYSMNKFLNNKRLKVRLSLTMQNVFFITKYKGLDPEVDGGLDKNIYPRPRTLLFGLHVNF